MAFFIAVIANHSKNVSFGPGYTCYINTISENIKICIFYGLVLTTAVLLSFWFILSEVLIVFSKCNELFEDWDIFETSLAGFWKWGLGFIWLFVPDMNSFGVDWPIFMLTILVYIMYNKRRL